MIDRKIVVTSYLRVGVARTTLGDAPLPRQALNYVESGNADAGIVYLSDAKSTPKVKIVATASEKTHSPVVYPIAVLKSSKNVDAAKDFVQFLSGNEAKTVFEKQGFTVAGS
ncbi:molybdate ABC transporter substrate-binding protein [Nostoc sp.]